MLIGGTAAFQIETGRWHGVKREERLCEPFVNAVCCMGPSRTTFAGSFT